MDITDIKTHRPEQMNWVDYCDLLGTQHCWSKVQVKPPFRIPKRQPDAGARLPSEQGQATEPV